MVEQRVGLMVVLMVALMVDQTVGPMVEQTFEMVVLMVEQKAGLMVVQTAARKPNRSHTTLFCRHLQMLTTHQYRRRHPHQLQTPSKHHLPR